MWGLLAGQAREWLSSDRGRLEKLRAGGGSVMVFLGVLIIVQAVMNS